jgi:sugar lactone lactonase YvrE
MGPGTGRRCAAIGAAATALLLAFGAGDALAVPRCRGSLPAPQALARTGDTLEYGLFDRRGRFLYSDQTKNAVMRIDRFGAQPTRLTAMASPGAMVLEHDGSVVVGYRDGARYGVLGDPFPQSQLWRIDPDTGAHAVIAGELGMANGIAQAADGTIYATNDFGFDLDRVRSGATLHGWAHVFSANGIVLSRDGRVAYVDETFAPPAIVRVPLADPSRATIFAASHDVGDLAAGLDDMAGDARGNLYVAANGGGQIWRVDGRGAICMLATGLRQPSAVTIRRRDLYFVTFGGVIGVLRGVVPAPPRRRR